MRRTVTRASAFLIRSKGEGSGGPYGEGVTDYEVLEIGGLDDWRSHYGGFRPESSRDGRRVVDHELTMQYIGLTANALEPGEQGGYWHRHARVEELYVFLEGHGQMGLDDDVVEVHPGTLVRVGQGVWRTWRCTPESAGVPDDSERAVDRPMPW